jgi:hypothetical protein
VRVFPHCRERVQTATRQSRQGRNNLAQPGTWIIHIICLKKIPDALKE